MQPIEIPYKFQCRQYQAEAWKALKSGKKRAVLCWHRGCGKDLFALNFLISEAMNPKKVGVYLHCFPNFSQAKKSIWKSVHGNEDGSSLAYLDHFPEAAIKAKNSSEMIIELKNGSIYCLLGLDGKNAQRARGMNPRFVILSEYAYMDPESWQTIEPRIAQNNGTALFISTPNGQNHFYNLYNYAKQNPTDYYSSLLTIEDTKVLDQNHLERLRKEGVPEDFIQQEYLCSFRRGAEGSYYGKAIQRARDENRITSININPEIPVHTSWDIGIGDSTSIFFFQTLSNGHVNVLHYYENNGEGLEHYLRYLDKWKSDNQAIYGIHYVPHDMKNRDFSTGVERITTARNLGYTMTVVPDHSLADGIQTVRALLPNCSFDHRNCERGIKCLDFYRKKWNDMLKVYYDEPLHDMYSHGADSFRYLAVGIKTIGTGINKLNAQTIKDMRMRNLGY